MTGITIRQSDPARAGSVALFRACMLCLALLCVEACGQRDGAVVELAGPTMGTRYSVQIAGAPGEAERDFLASAVEMELAYINGLMSTYDPDSELSRFNAFTGDGWFAVSPETLEVVSAALAMSKITDGAFDVTVGPLVNIWGFGPELEPESLPSAEEISAALERVGYTKIMVRSDPPALSKSRPDLYVDLSAIAKGYAVDRLAALLERNGISDYLVEIGGEVRVSGHNGAGEAWRLAVESPRSARRVPMRIIQLTSGGVATSGNYRNFFEIEGLRYGHSIDPRTGWPVRHALLAVTVVAEDTMTADAWATALMVLGPENGLVLADREGVAALLLSDQMGSVQEQFTGDMRRLLNVQAPP